MFQRRSAQTCVTAKKNDKGIRESSLVRPKHKYYYCRPIWVRIPPPPAALVCDTRNAAAWGNAGPPYICVGNARRMKIDFLFSSCGGIYTTMLSPHTWKHNNNLLNKHWYTLLNKHRCIPQRTFCDTNLKRARFAAHTILFRLQLRGDASPRARPSICRDLIQSDPSGGCCWWVAIALSLCFPSGALQCGMPSTCVVVMLWWRMSPRRDPAMRRPWKMWKCYQKWYNMLKASIYS